jgi:4-amino-4-deoxy-L-arabinose transferase-like glycosyltransferase
LAAESYWSQQPRRLREDWRVVLGLAVVLILAYLPGLGSYGLYDPWETHYGEVSRNMVESSDYVDPWWGSPWDPNGVKREREGFYSKPPLIMWMTSAGMNLFGYSELGVRLFFPFTAILALLAIYLAVSRFVSRRAGLIATAICGTVPIFAFMSRQAVPDGPMTALMTGGMMALCLGLFHVKDDEEASPFLYWGTLGLVLITMLGQLWIMLPMDRSPDVLRPYPGHNPFFAIQWYVVDLFNVMRGKGWCLALLLVPGVVWCASRVAKQRRRRMLYIYLFYIACGLSVPAKGWLDWAPMGGAIVLYLFVTWEWKILRTVDVAGGLLIVFMTGHPWVIAMLGGHHPAWFNRFIIIDHFSRLTGDSDNIDHGSFEYYFRWVGYGLFPLIGLLPGAFARAIAKMRRPVDREYTPRERFELMVFLWAIAAFALFTYAPTKYHHYIFPAIPAFAILMGLFVDDVLNGLGRGRVLLLVAGAVLTFWVGQDLWRMPKQFGDGSQNMVNLFTYKYDREWAKYTPPEGLDKLQGEALDTALQDNVWLSDFANDLGWMGLLAAGGLVFLAVFRDWKREYGVAVLGVAGGWCLWWSLHDYLPQVSHHWSQKEMWDTYYARCTKFGPDEQAEYERQMLLTVQRVPERPELYPRARCKEPIVAFRTNWRGETFYSANTVLPAPEVKQLDPALKTIGDRPFYLFTENGRIKSELDPNLPAKLKGRYEKVYDNKKFTLLRVDPSLPSHPLDR